MPSPYAKDGQSPVELKNVYANQAENLQSTSITSLILFDLLNKIGAEAVATLNNLQDHA